MGHSKRGHLNGTQWYSRENRYRVAFIASRGLLDAREIQARAGCNEGLALLIASARRLACLEVLDAYERGELTFRQLWRACEYAGDERTQRKVAGLASSAA